MKTDEPMATVTVLAEPESDTKPSRVLDAEPKKVDKIPEVETVLADDINAETLWNEVLQEIKQNYNTLYGIARMAKPRLEDDTLILQLKFAFHLKRIQEAKNYKILVNCIEKLRGKPTKLQCEIAEPSETKDKAPTAANDVSAISNIFGGAELL